MSRDAHGNSLWRKYACFHVLRHGSAEHMLSFASHRRQDDLAFMCSSHPCCSLAVTLRISCNEFSTAMALGSQTADSSRSCSRGRLTALLCFSGFTTVCPYQHQQHQLVPVPLPECRNRQFTGLHTVQSETALGHAMMRRCTAGTFPCSSRVNAVSWRRKHIVNASKQQDDTLTKH